MTTTFAPGWPGIDPRWTSSAKDGIGTAFNRESRVWFAISHGVLNEIYYPRIDQACTRDMGFLVTANDGFFSEEKRQTITKTTCTPEGVPHYIITNTCASGRFRIEKEIIADPKRPVLLQRVRFTALGGVVEDYQLYALLAPHLGNRGAGNTAWIDQYLGRSMLFAHRDGTALAMASSTDWLGCSAGFVGASDGWHDIAQNHRMSWRYDRAENGNVALTGEIDIPHDGGAFVLAIGFGDDGNDAAQHALDSLDDGFDVALDLYTSEWNAWYRSHKPTGHPLNAIERTSAMIMRTCESKSNPGGIVASLSIPWGFSKGDDDLGGYHLVWPRDLVETAQALLALGAIDDCRDVMDYLRRTQHDDGHWAQNMWIDGSVYWTGIQLDETAFPILLADQMHRHNALSDEEIDNLWPCLKNAARFLVLNGPVTGQDRWEEDPGYSPFTLAVTIAALVVAAELAKRNNEPEVARHLLETADQWNDSIERWTYVTDTELAQQNGVDGYFVRIAPPDVAEGSSCAMGYVPIKNRPPEEANAPAAHLISPDALALVRFGLRAADDKRIVNTVKVIDAVLKVDTPRGPAWHRYNFDGYGEHADGAPFDGTGIGRAWPLFSGERGHYELAAGRKEIALARCDDMESFANQSGYISEQIWDVPDIASRKLHFGQPSGSAMPLVWAHAEYVKLRRSIEDGAVFDTPPQCVERYIKGSSHSPYAAWRFSQRLHTINKGKTLRLELQSPAMVHWSADDWASVHDTKTHDTTLGLHVADLETDSCEIGTTIRFTFRWTGPDRWEGTDYAVRVVAPE